MAQEWIVAAGEPVPIGRGDVADGLCGGDLRRPHFHDEESGGSAAGLGNLLVSGERIEVFFGVERCHATGTG